MHTIANNSAAVALERKRSIHLFLSLSLSHLLVTHSRVFPLISYIFPCSLRAFPRTVINNFYRGVSFDPLYSRAIEDERNVNISTRHERMKLLKRL